MSAESSPKLGWLRIGVENETPLEEIDGLIQKVADYKLEGVIYIPGNYSQMGTVIEASIEAVGLRDLELLEELSLEEKIERDEINRLYHEFEFDEI
jgi:hypothetical protein